MERMGDLGEDFSYRESLTKMQWVVKNLQVVKRDRTRIIFW
jgi:hypothetical protein